MSASEKTKLIAVVGPTASGKSALAAEIAKTIGGEIVSCDSMQIYRGMDIGTAKPTAGEMSEVRHHLIDVCDPEQPFSCADYKPLAEGAISDITSRGKIPVFCGGTGLYLDSVISIPSFSPEVPEGIREELMSRSPEELWDELLRVDPESTEKTHKNNVKRVVRALEIYRGTGKTKTEWDRLSKETEPPYDTLIIGLDYLDREILYRRIGQRIGVMLESGLVDEVKRLGLPRGCNAAQAIGYKEIYLYLDGRAEYGEAVALLEKNTRNYAKRQLTWFRRNKSIKWFYPDSPGAENNLREIMREINRHLYPDG